MATRVTPCSTYLVNQPTIQITHYHAGRPAVKRAPLRARPRRHPNNRSALALATVQYDGALI